jgi:hypothetical protein
MWMRCCAACRRPIRPTWPIISAANAAGSGSAMATVIEYYVPQKLRKQGGKWIPPNKRGKIIPFPVLEEKSVLRRLGLGWPPRLT